MGDWAGFVIRPLKEVALPPPARLLGPGGRERKGCRQSKPSTTTSPGQVPISELKSDGASNRKTKTQDPDGEFHTRLLPATAVSLHRRESQPAGLPPLASAPAALR